MRLCTGPAPPFPAATRTLGYRGEFERAEAELARVRELEPRMSLDVAQARVVLLWRQDRLADLVELASQVIGGKEFHFTILKELHQVRFIALLRLGRKPEAMAAAAARVELDGHDLGAWLDYAQLQDRLQAEKTIRRAAEKNAGDGDPAQLVTQGFGALAQRLSADGRAEDAAYFSALAGRN